MQTTKAGDVNWIVETKGRVWEGTAAKDDAIEHWCERVSAATGTVWRYMRVNQAHFEPWKWASLAQILDHSTPESLLASDQ
jgi:type III restriction enzyme